MIYVFDSNSLSKLKHFYPSIFKSLWEGLDWLVASGELVSTREVWNEMQRGNPDPHVHSWLNERKGLFKTPNAEELKFVAEILGVPHFQSLIGEKQRLRGTPVADPFVIACAKVKEATVVTEELAKPHAAKIPNVCEYFGNIQCITLQEFMERQDWDF